MAESDILKVEKLARKLRENVERVIVGKADAIELVLAAVLCEGHVLLEDVPGIGKTMLARSVARSLGFSFRRIQCTPDLLPSDITGSYIFNQCSSAFEFRAGPVFAQLVLADEINRATPRTQSALLEAMEERQVTVEGETRELPRPFLVMATQNPVELEGTFPLPEAQLDRFMMKVKLGYPDDRGAATILERFVAGNPILELAAVSDPTEVYAMQQICRAVLVNDQVKSYIISLIQATRDHPEVELGASPRAMLSLTRVCQALAASRGRAFVIPDDVKYLSNFVLGHRLIVRPQGYLKGVGADAVIAEVLKKVPVPVKPGEPGRGE